MGTILLVDDDPAFLTQVRKMLSEAGYEVLEAPDGEGAARVLEERRGQIDLAIVDLLLPGVNGFELIGAISRRPNSVKVIATSGIFRDKELCAATTVGAHATIRKPPPNRSLPREAWLNTIEQLIGKD